MCSLLGFTEQPKRSIKNNKDSPEQRSWKMPGDVGKIPELEAKNISLEKHFLLLCK